MKVILIAYHLLVVSALFGQTLCDTVDGEIRVFTYLEKMPSSNLTFEQS